MDNSTDLENGPFPKIEALDRGDGPEVTDFSPDAWQPPISLRIVAFTFILFGILSIVDVLLRWLILSRIFINFGCLLVLVGWGLRRWSKAARGWALFISWAALAMLVVWLFLASYVASGGKLPPNVSVSGTSPKAIAFECLCIAYSIWQLWVLRRADIVRRFDSLQLSPRIPRKMRQWWKPQFSLESMLLATIVVAFVINDIQSRELWWNDSFGSQHFQSADGKERRRADYIVATHRVFERPEQLHCLLLTRGDEAKHGTSYSTFGSGDRITIYFANGREEVLNVSGRQLYQIDNGQLRSIDERVSKAEFDRFTASQPADWSIEALVSFAKLSRAKAMEGSSESEASN